MKINLVLAFLLFAMSTSSASAENFVLLHTSQKGNVLENTFLRSDGVGSFSTMGGSETRHSFRIKKRKNRKFWNKFESLNLDDYRIDSSGPKDEKRMEAKTNHLILIRKQSVDGTEGDVQYIIPKNAVPEDIQEWLDLLFVFART